MGWEFQQYHSKAQPRAQLVIFNALCQLLAGRGTPHKAFLLVCWKQSQKELYLTRILEPIWLEPAVLHRGWEVKTPGKSMSPEWTEASFMKNGGRDETVWECDMTQSVGKIYFNPIYPQGQSFMSLFCSTSYEWKKTRPKTNVRLYGAWPVSWQNLCKSATPPVRTLHGCKTTPLIQDSTYKTARQLLMESNMC